MPDGLEADYELSTFEGQLRSVFAGMERRATKDGSPTVVQRGRGEAAVVVRSFSGDVVVEQRAPPPQRRSRSSRYRRTDSVSNSSRQMPSACVAFAAVSSKPSGNDNTPAARPSGLKTIHSSGIR